MILPTKGVRPDKALISVGAGILRDLNEPKTVSRLWADVRRQNRQTLQITFDWFVLSLDLLFLMGVVEYAAGRVVRRADRTTEGSSP